MGDRRNDHTWPDEERQWMQEFPEGHWRGIDASKGEVLLLEVGRVMSHSFANVSGFWSKDHVQHKLYTICHSQDPVDPSIAPTVGNEAEDERCSRDTDRHHYSPDAYVTGSFFLEERLFDDATANSSSRADEEGCDGSADRHCGI